LWPKGLSGNFPLNIEFEMALASASDSITVESAAPAVSTESAVVRTAIDRTFIENTSLDGRSFQTLLMVFKTEDRKMNHSVCTLPFGLLRLALQRLTPWTALDSGNSAAVVWAVRSVEADA
jgi:hypothetical protein